MSTDMMCPSIPWTHTFPRNLMPLVQHDGHEELNRGLVELWT